jgi:REP element-mobilizing transposase RayT
LLKPKNISKTSFNNRFGKPQIDILSAVLMPNHFHLQVRFSEKKFFSISMMRFIDSYTKYFNHKYHREGRLFSSSIKTVTILTDEQNIYLSSYIHRNPLGSKQSGISSAQLSDYPWSTYPQYTQHPSKLPLTEKCKISTNMFCNSQPILNHFKNQQDYKDFVTQTSEFSTSLNKNILIDQS